MTGLTGLPSGPDPDRSCASSPSPDGSPAAAAPAAPPHRTMALDQPGHRRRHPPGGHPLWLTSRNCHYHQEGQHPGPWNPAHPARQPGPGHADRRKPARADSTSVEVGLPQITLQPACSRSRRRFGRCFSNSRARAEVRTRTSHPPTRLGSCRIRERLRTSCHSPVCGASAAAVTSTAPVTPSE
jgi:hypothetical protein